MSSEPTKDRVERAIELHQRELEILSDNLDSDERNNWELRDYISAYKTALAALDAVRWRDVETEPPETNATVLVRWKAENGVQGYKFSYFEDGNWYGNSGYKIVEWLPLPTWE